MGRGRQKAKHTKVARELKYFSPEVDLGKLQEELSHEDAEQELIDKWADMFPEDEETEDSAKDEAEDNAEGESKA